MLQCVCVCVCVCVKSYKTKCHGQSHLLFRFFLGGGAVGGGHGRWVGGASREVGGAMDDWVAVRDEVEEDSIDPVLNLLRY